MWPFKKPKKVVVMPLEERGPYAAVWHKGMTLNSGAQRYGWSTLGLVQQAQIGASVPVHEQIRSMQGPQMIYNQTVTVAGIPLAAGQIFGQSLIDPNSPGSGYTDPVTGVTNIPYPKFDIAPAGIAV